jgi:hypothetical protein
MMKRLIFILLVSNVLEAQVKTQTATIQADSLLSIPLVNSTDQQSPITRILKKVEFGLQTNSIEKFKNELGEIVSITISSGEQGYYSANQALSVLANYFSERQLGSFKFSTICEKGSMPYATGRFNYVQKGIRKSAQVYVSLTRQDSLWVISQFNIY